MPTLRKLAPWVLLAALAGAGAARADDDCLRLVEPYGPVDLGRGEHEVAFDAPVVAGAQWFVAVERLGPSPGEVSLNGQVVVSRRQLASPARAFVRVDVALQATNQLRVEVTGQTTLRVAVLGLAPASALPAGVGRPVAALTLYERAFLGGFPPRLYSTRVPLPTTAGLFTLEARQGGGPLSLATLTWNDRFALGALPILPGRGLAAAPVPVEATNDLFVAVLGAGGSFVTVTLSGHVVDEDAPTAAWSAPAEGGLAFRDEDPFVLAFDDALSGATSVRIALNGEDVTSSFTVSAGEARSTFAALRERLTPGANTLTAVVRDRACNEAAATRTFLADLLPPVLEQPADVTVDAQTPDGAVVTYEPPRATDDTDPAPVVVCAPASGSLFPVGVTTVTCTATDHTGKSSQVTFTVTVQAPSAQVERLELSVGAPRRAPPDEDALLTLATDAPPIDGAGHDPASPDEGRAGARLQRRLLSSAYADGVSAPAGPSRRSARDVSNAVHAQAASAINARGASDYLWFWGQLLDHDLSLTRAHQPPEPLPIPVSPTDATYDPTWSGTVTLPFNRSAHDPASSPREQTSEVTAWLDGSMIYGADPARAAALRRNDGTGRLLTSAGDLLPINVAGLDNLPSPFAPGFFLAGDVRANQTVPLLALHTVFVREHNRLADLLRARFLDATDEQLYQSARRIVVAELQAITYQEFLPVLLGPDALAPYGGHRPELDVGVESAFAHAAFRVGHSLLSPSLLRLDADLRPIAEGPLPLREALFAPARLTEGGGLEPLLRGAARQHCQELDALVVDDVRNYLFGQPGQGGLDLAAFDVQRGRDHGLPSYNDARRQLGLAPRASFAEVSADPDVRARLAAAYASIEDVDLVVGAQCEDHASGAMVGELARTLLRRQFELLRDGDLFYYEHAFSGPALDALHATRLADVIRRNTSIGQELPDDVFLGPLLPFTEHDFTVRAVTASGETVSDFGAVVAVSVSDGKAPLDGLVFELSQGQATLPGLAFFQTLGDLVITARTVPLAPGEPEVAGSLTVTVQLAAPVVFPELPPLVDVGQELTIQGLSFVGQQVELVIDGQLVATEVAGPTGAFTLSARLAPGTHQVLVRSVDPATGQLVASRTSSVEQVAPSPGGLEVSPASVSLPVGRGQQLTVLERFLDETRKDVTARAAYATSDPAVATVSASGVISAHRTGSATVSVSFDGFAVLVPVTVTVPILHETSPAHLEANVAPSRETVLRFSAPLQASTVTPSAIHAEYAGAPLAAALHLSADRRTVTLFYAGSLPTSARVRVTVLGDLLLDDQGDRIDVDRDGLPGGTATIDFDTLTITVIAGTAAYGRVFSSRLAHQYSPGEPGYVEGAPMDGEGEPGAPYDPDQVISVNVPLGGARISVVGAEDTLFTFTDETGSFRLEPAPAGTFFVHVEVVDPERRLNYPDIGKPWTTIAGEETAVGDIYLPIIADDAMQTVSDTETVTIGFTDAIAAEFPHLVGTQLTIPAGSLYSTTGSTEPKQVGIAPVPPDRLPAPLPDGLAFSVVFTIQTTGGDNFDVPAPARFPNSEGLPPGTKTALWSFNHDTGQWEVIGSMTVSADGLWVETDPGVGILAPGWHGVQSGSMGEDQPSEEDDDPDKEEPDPDGDQEPTNEDEDCTAQCKYPCEGSVILSSGEERLDRVDVVIPGRGDLHFMLRRRYRSQLGFDGPLGKGWDFDYDEHLFVRESGDVTRNNGRSHLDTWTRNADGSFTAPRGFFSTLTQQEDGTYVLRERDGFERHFAANGFLLRHHDRYGNVMQFEHDEYGDLDFVVDAYGREIDFTFQAFADGQRRLTKVKDFAAREWLYTYDALGHLTAVRSPIVVGTSTGNDFPAGRTERYTYSSGFSEPRLNHNLLTITSPEEVARGGPPSLVITYGTDPDDPLTFDKVIAREEGGINASGVSAGGRSTIGYELLNQDVPLGDKTVPRKRATIVDPNGNLRTSYVNEDDQHIIDRIYTRGLRPGEPQFFETRHDFNQDNLVVRTVHSSGDEVLYTYGAGSRAAQKNLLEVRRRAGPRGQDGQGAPAEDLVTTFTYEPLYNRVLTVTDPRGNSTTYTPPLGTNDPGRYTTRLFYDYMEHEDPVPQAVALGIDLSSVPRGLGDLNGDGRTDQSFGNVVRTEAPSVLLSPDSHEAQRLGSTTQRIVTETRWNDRGQVVAAVDAEGNLTTFEHHPENDPDGDGLLTFSFMRALTSAPTGHLRSVTVDAGLTPRRSSTTPPQALTTSYRYDRVGNVIAVRNPRGVETHLEVTALNQVVVTTRGADVTNAIATQQLLTGEGALRYKARAFYDFNGRVVKTEVENRDSTTQGVGAFVERSQTYDILGNLLSATAEVDATTALTTTFSYDPNQNLVEVTAPEGNKVVSSYDERDLPFTITRGAGTPDASTITLDYDPNGNRVRVTDAEDTDGDGQREQTTFTFDGYDRLVEARDALGNRALTAYDVASNVTRAQVFGHPATAPTSPHVLLSDTRFSHDELGRVFRTDASLFLAGGFVTARPVNLSDHDGDGLVTARIDYDALSRVTSVVEDDLERSFVTYDGLSRPIERSDALGNRVLTTYDRNSNPVAVTAVEVSPEGLVPSETFTTRYVYDQLDRLVRATDNAGHTSRFAYDSRDLLVLKSDPEGALTADPLGLFPGAINGPGNTCSYVFDGLGRMVRQLCDLRVGGTGAGPLDTTNPTNPDGQISLGYVFDRNSRLVGIVDDNGNRTSFGYDALDRKTSQTNADGESYAFTYDREHNVRTVTDPNGTVVTKTYDALNRLLELTVARGPGVLGTTRETYSYDGLSRLVQATDDNGDAATSNQITQYVYDSLGRTLEERQNGRAVSSQYTGDGKRTSVTYPGGRTIARTFDAIDRIKQLRDGATTLAHTDWIGPGLRELRRVNGNATRLTFLNDAGNADVGYDAVQRLVRLRCVLPDGSTAFVDREYAYNRASQRTLERRHDDFGLTDRYTYDSAYRVASSAYDQDGLPGAVPRTLHSISYLMDGVGNRRSVSKGTDTGTTTEAYAVNAVNEYTSVAGVARTNDDNGNLTDDGTRLFFYDYKNRLVGASDKATARPIVAYAYLPDGRRSRKTIFSQTTPGQVVKASAFFYDGAQEVEEQDAGSGATEATYVWSPVYVDELVTYTNSQGTFYTHQDARCSVVAITDAAGAIVERVRFDDFGKAEIRGPGGQVRAASAVGCAYGFQGRRLDAETGLLYFRARMYDPETGRFLQRDPVWDAGNVGGQYTFVGNNPTTDRDAFGLQGWAAADYSGGTYTPNPGSEGLEGIWTGLVKTRENVLFDYIEAKNSGDPSASEHKAQLDALDANIDALLSNHVKHTPEGPIESTVGPEAIVAFGLGAGLMGGGVEAAGSSVVDDVLDTITGFNPKQLGKDLGETLGNMKDQLAKWLKDDPAPEPKQWEDFLEEAQERFQQSAGRPPSLEPCPRPGVGPGDDIWAMAKKKRKSGQTASEAADDIPSWAQGVVPDKGQKGKDLATELLDEKYGKGNWKKGAGSEFSKLQKYFDRAFEDP